MGIWRFINANNYVKRWNKICLMLLRMLLFSIFYIYKNSKDVGKPVSVF